MRVPLTVDRISPTDIGHDELDQVSLVLDAQVGQAQLVSSAGTVELPEALYGLLVDVVAAVREGRTIVLVPEDDDLTTQQAADLIGVSRPHLVKLIEQGRIPCRRVGTHRRIAVRDLQKYQLEADAERRRLLDSLFGGMVEEGSYE